METAIYLKITAGGKQGHTPRKTPSLHKNSSLWQSTLMKTIQLSQSRAESGHLHFLGMTAFNTVMSVG